MAGYGRRKKRRVAPPQDEEEARRKFLEALEAQRANARSQSGENPAVNQAQAAPAAPLPGFYYDETKRRYFRSSPASERRQQEQLEIQQKQQNALHKPQINVKSRRGYAVSGNNWVANVAKRQSDWSWSARGRDRRQLMPQMMSKLLSSQVVESQDVYNDGRLTALALHPQASNLGAIGASGGRLDILGLRSVHVQAGAEAGATLQHVLPIIDFNVGGVITALQWRPVLELDLLVCQLGTAPRGNSRAPSGSVCFLRVGDQETHGVALTSTARMKQLKFVDPWVAKWNPTNTSKFSVGCGGSRTAMYVDAVTEIAGIQLGPVGSITSDVHAQGFYSTGHVVLNGTKSGGFWGWDLRTPRRIYEWEADTPADQPVGSIIDIHVLSDDRRAIVQRSSGELRMVDLRTFKPVVEFMPGATKSYLPSLRCAVDSYESVVVAGGDPQRPLTVNTYDLQTGCSISSLEVRRSAVSELPAKRPTLVQQVQLKSSSYESRFADTPEVWAITRNELYVCSMRSDNALE